MSSRNGELYTIQKLKEVQGAITSRKISKHGKLFLEL